MVALTPEMYFFFRHDSILFHSEAISGTISTGNQGDQIGRIFASRKICLLFKKFEKFHD
jgi:hypothetical protein